MPKKKAAKRTVPARPPKQKLKDDALRLLRLPEFLSRLEDNVSRKLDTRFCFVLGSGASVQSEVPSGSNLVNRWLMDLYTQDKPGASADGLRAWCEKNLKDIPNFTWDTRADFYGRIYNRRFRDNAEGQDWLRGIMKDKVPSFGYTVLAQILSNTRHNLVITTNFDNLLHDALIAIGRPRFFVAHSPAEAQFLHYHDDKPRIIKLHGDIDRETYNAESLIGDLAEEWREPLRQLLGAYTPVFIGYGGCDPGFMKFLNQELVLAKSRPRPIWAFRVDLDALKKTASSPDNPPGRPVTPFARDFEGKHESWWLPIPGFDELMLLLSHRLNQKHGREEILAVAERAAEEHEKSRTEACRTARLHDGKLWCRQLDALTKQAEKWHLGENGRWTWNEWREYINASVTPAEEEERCRGAIAVLPDDFRPYAKLAWCLAEVKPNDPQVEESMQDAWRRLDGKYNQESSEMLHFRNTRGVIWGRQGKNKEAEQEHREVLQIKERVFGAEHSSILMSRMNLAIALGGQGNNIEAEQEHRSVLSIRERRLGVEHPKVFESCYNLAICLRRQKKLKEALEFMQRAEAGRTKVLGAEHPDSKKAKQGCERIESKLAGK